MRTERNAKIIGLTPFPDTLFAWTRSSPVFKGILGGALGGLVRAAGDIGLVVNCAYAIVPGPRMAPIIPAAITAAGIGLVAAPLHATSLDGVVGI